MKFKEALLEKFSDAEELFSELYREKVYCEFFLNPSLSEIKSCIKQSQEKKGSDAALNAVRGILSVNNDLLVWRADVLHETAIDYVSDNSQFKKLFKCDPAHYTGMNRNFFCLMIYKHSIDTIEMTPDDSESLIRSKMYKKKDRKDILSSIQSKHKWVKELQL